MWWIYLQITRNNLSVMFRKWEVPLRMQKTHCGSYVQKKKQELTNYLSAHFYTACFRQNIEYYNMIRFFFENSLISQNQSGFKLSDSSTNQVLSFTHQIYKSFDNSHEILSVLVLNMLKAFYKVWHKHLIFKLKQNGISASLLSTITDFLKLRKQRVVLND